MTPLASMEHVIDRVHLVRGKGSRRKGGLCVMSFVALLAGEGHTDAPATASPFIRQFAIAINDAMPEEERQRLKLFAPRMVGTNDGLDRERLRLVRRISTDELLPRLRADQAGDWLPGRPEKDWSIRAAAEDSGLPGDLTAAVVANACQSVSGCGTGDVALTAARLLITCAVSAPATSDGNWYWSKAIDVLDRLCSVGIPERRAGVGADRVAHAAYVLDHRERLEVAALVVKEVAQRFRRRLRIHPRDGGPAGSCRTQQGTGPSGEAPTRANGPVPLVGESGPLAAGAGKA